MYRWRNQENQEYVIRLSDGKCGSVSSYNPKENTYDDVYEGMLEWVLDGNVVESYWTKERALYWKRNDVDVQNSHRNKDEFIHGGILWVADRDSIESTLVICTLLKESDPVPTDDGTWTDATGTDHEMTVRDFREMARTFYQRGAKNFKKKKRKARDLEMMYLDPNVTVEDIRSYNEMEGWNE